MSKLYKNLCDFLKQNKVKDIYIDYVILEYLLEKQLTEKYKDLIEYIVLFKKIVGEHCNDCHKIVYMCSCHFSLC